MPAVSKAQQRFMGMVHAADKGETPASPEVAKVSASMKDSDAKDFASTKHKGLPDHVKEAVKEIVRGVLRGEGAFGSVGGGAEDARNLMEMSPNDVHFKTIIKLYDRGGSFTKKKVGVVVSRNPRASRNTIIDDLKDMDYHEILNAEDELGIKEIVEKRIAEQSVNEAKYPTDLKVGSVILGQGFTMLKGIEGGKYYKVVAIDDYSATLVPSDKNGNVKGSSKVRHKLDSIEGGIRTAKRGDENGIVVIKESVTEEHDCGCNEDYDCGCGGLHEHHINEDINADANGIAGLTASRANAVKDFIEKHKLDSNKLYQFLKKGGLKDKMDFVTALVGKPGNSIQTKLIKQFSK
jgi:hypothetical protein